MPTFVIELLRWLKEQLPQLATAWAVWVYTRMRALILRERMLKDKAVLEKKYMENEDAVEKENSGKSDADVVRDAIREGRDDS